MTENNPPQPARAPANSSSPTQRATGFERAASAVRTVLPLLLPLLDGNFASAAAGLLGPKAPAPAPPSISTILKTAWPSFSPSMGHSAFRSVSKKRLSSGSKGSCSF